MKLFSPLLVLLALALPLTAQHTESQHDDSQRPTPSAPRANQGHVPPPPPARTGPQANSRSDAERSVYGRINEMPHVNHDTWYGHSAVNDPRFHIEHPFEHGHFANFGPSFRYTIARIDAAHHEFWLPGGFYFQVADWDWGYFTDQCWNCGDDFVVYDDPDHIGWYLLYNVHTGVYIHVQYLGM